MKPYPDKGQRVTHPAFGHGFITTRHAAVIYVKWDGKAMALPFLIRDLQWLSDIAAWTLRKDFEKVC